ncbi:MAG: N-acetylgalactosamine-6-sulfatase [Verrucomicrobia bacterium]|jgi:arylsulfatase B|nr:N-acetylgalactosamine-6-sulfatase [Verrucomicrobiota bacterium]
MKARLHLLAWLLLVGATLAHAAERRPNVIVLLADDLGYSELGCQGNAGVLTPNIDSLARNGVRFTQGYVSAPFCCPSRAGLMTGRYQTRFGHELNVVGKGNLDPSIGLPLTERAMAEHLKAAGYRTGLVGKWHLGGVEKFHPQKRGFDEFYGFLHEGHFFVPPPFTGVTSFLRTNSVAFGERFTNGPVIWSNHVRGNEPPYDAENPMLRGTREITEPEYLTEAFTREAVGFITRNEKQPFFLYVAYNAVHSPMQATPEQLARFAHIPDMQRRIFAAMLSSLDDSVGALLAKLRELKLEENTLIFFLSDNGGPTQELTSSNAPLRGGKGQLFEGGIRVPFLAQWKGKIPAGKVYEQAVISLDILATSLSAAQVAPTGENKLDGVNLLPFLRGEKQGAPHEVLFWRYGANIAVRSGDWKLVKQREPGKGEPEFQLFNLREDLAEAKPVKDEAIAKRLQRELDGLNHQMVEALWGAGRK